MKAWQGAFLGMCICVCLNSTSHAAPTVQSLRYGTTLFNFFQQDYYAALTELTVAQKLDQLGPHKDKGELLRGGMSLSYGMDQVAKAAFDALLSAKGDLQLPDDRDRAWFYLAKLAWRRGDTTASEYALDKMSSPYKGPFLEESTYLHSSLALRYGNEQQALDYARRLPLNSPWQYYLYYNLGAIQASEANWGTAIKYFSQLDQMSFVTEEAKLVHDRALTASGFALMEWGKFDAAQEQFKRVRLDSPLSGHALLGYGWASSEMGNYRLALSSWQTLSDRQQYSPAARESLLAIPHAYEELGRPGIALDNYRLAATAYLSQLAEIRETIVAFRTDDLAELLDLDVARPESAGHGGVSGTDTHGWIFGEALLPGRQYSVYLTPLLTRHSFQVSMRELQDLYRLAANMAVADHRRQVLNQVAKDQLASWSTVIEGDRRDRLAAQQYTLQVQINALENKLLEAADDTEGARLLADSQQSNLWRRLDRAAGILDHQPNHTSSSNKAERLALYRGLMVWRDSEQFPARSWLLKREIKKLEGVARQSAIILERIDHVIAMRGEFEFSQRIETMDTRISSQRQQLEALIGRSELQLRRLAVADLEQQEVQLSRALGQSRLAIARLFDKSSPEVSR